MTNNDLSKDVGGDNIVATVGDNATDLIIGKNIRKTTYHSHYEITENDLTQVRELFMGLRAQIDELVPVEKKDAAVERIGELEDAILAEEPDITTMKYVKNWFQKHLPQLANGVTAILISPTVNKVVEIAGNLAEGALQQQLGLG